MDRNSLLKECRSFLNITWQVVIDKVYREANMVADRVANWSIGQSIGYQLLPSPPNSVCNLLMNDVASMSRSRIVSMPSDGM